MIKKFDDALLALTAVAELQQRSITVSLSDEFNVTIRSLGAKDETDTFIECMNFWGQAFIYKHKTETMCRCITHINGLSVTDVDILARKTIIESWNQGLIDNIYFEYAKLIGSVDDFFEKIKLSAQTNVVASKEAMAKVKEEEAKAGQDEK